MSTVANSPIHEHRGIQSGAISKGADLLLALFEAEKAKVTAASSQQLKEVEVSFSKYRQSSEQRIYDLEAAIRHVNAALARSVADGSLAREQTLEAQHQCARAAIGLSQLRDSVKEAGFVWDWKSLKLARAGTENVTTDDTLQPAKEQADSLVGVEELQKQLAEARKTLEDQKRICIRVEQERDYLKTAMDAEITVLKGRIFSLQHEAEQLKRGSQLAIHPSTDVSRSDNDLLPRLDTLRSDAKSCPPYETPSSTSNNIAVASDTTSSRASDPLPSSSTATRGSPSANLSNDLPEFQSTRPAVPSTSNSTIKDTADPTSRSLSAPSELSSLIAEYHRNFNTTLPSKDNNESFSKRPASAPLISLPDSSMKRIKLDHPPHNKDSKSVPDISVYSRPLQVIDQLTVTNHILSTSQMAAANHQNYVQPPRPLKIFSYLPKSAERSQQLSSNSPLTKVGAKNEHTASPNNSRPFTGIMK